LKEQRENFLSSESGDTARDLFEEWITLELATVYTDEQLTDSVSLQAYLPE
jgi:hypothetical protein